jgi:uncharacterized MAPEG superfamily protein
MGYQFQGINTPLFVAYCVTAILLCLNLLVLWGASGGARTSAKITANPEDAKAFGASVSDHDPPTVARVLRAHANAQAVIYPFLMIGLLYVLACGSFWVAAVLFALFVVARFAHSGCYLAGLQPWRTISFTVSGLVTLVLIGALIWRLATMGHAGS